MKKIMIIVLMLSNILTMAQQHQIPFRIDPGNNLMVVKVVINNSFSRNFYWDTGASSITISESLFSAMVKSGDINKNDILGKTKCSIADGSIVDALVIQFKTLAVGTFVLNNIEALVLPGSNSSFLLGQSVFQKFGKIAVDYNTKMIVLETGSSTNNPQLAGLTEVRIIACSKQKQGEIKSIQKELSSGSVQITTISEEPNIPPQKAIDRIQGEYVVRYFDSNNFDQAKKISEILEKSVKGEVELENMLQFYDNPISNYVEIWIK